MDFHPYEPIHSLLLCSAQPVYLFRQFLNPAWGSQGQRRIKAPLGGPGGQENCALFLLPKVTPPAFKCPFLLPRTMNP